MCSAIIFKTAIILCCILLLLNGKAFSQAMYDEAEKQFAIVPYFPSCIDSFAEILINRLREAASGEFMGDADDILSIVSVSGCEEKVKRSYSSLVYDTVLHGQTALFRNLVKYSWCRDLFENRFGVEKLTLLHLIVKMENLEFLETFLNVGDSSSLTQSLIAAQDVKGRTPLHIASLHNVRVEVVETLVNRLNCSQSFRTFDDSGFTPFLRAVQTENLALVDFFISNQATQHLIFDTHKRLNESILHIAVKNGFHEILDLVSGVMTIPEILLNGRNYRGWTPLHFAAASNDEFLLSKVLSWENVNSSITTNFGRNALHIACLNRCDVDIFVQLLRDPGIDINLLDKHEESPLDIAIRLKQFEIVELLYMNRAFVKPQSRTILHQQIEDMIVKSLKSRLSI